MALIRTSKASVSANSITIGGNAGSNPRVAVTKELLNLFKYMRVVTTSSELPDWATGYATSISYSIDTPTSNPQTLTSSDVDITSLTFTNYISFHANQPFLVEFHN